LKWWPIIGSGPILYYESTASRLLSSDGSLYRMAQKVSHLPIYL